MDESEARRSFQQTDRLYEQYGRPLERSIGGSTSPSTRTGGLSLTSTWMS